VVPRFSDPGNTGRPPIGSPRFDVPAAPASAPGAQFGGLNPEAQTVARCAAGTGGNPLGTLGCAATQLTQSELDKCRNGIGTPGGCFGPGNTIRQFVENGVRDLTQGPGSGNDLFGSDGWMQRTFGVHLQWPF